MNMDKKKKRILFKPVKLNNIRLIKRMPLYNLTWSQASMRFPRMSPFGDKDRDGIPNMFDCRPFNKKKHGDPILHWRSRYDVDDEPEQSEGDKSAIIKAVWWKKQWKDFREEKRKGNIPDSVDINEFVENRKNIKEAKEAKRLKDQERARELGLLEEE
jgi:hypothetical protein